MLYDDRMADEFDNSAKELIAEIKEIFDDGDYVAIFGFLQFVLRHQECPYRFPERIDWALKTGQAAYRIVDGKTIIPISSDAEYETVKRAFADLNANEFHGSREHLRQAAIKLTAGDVPGSIRESIHAVKSVARMLAPSGGFGEALGKLDKPLAIHGALKRGFASIYGYTSDEDGIRHPLLDDPKAKVDETDAVFMIGACASFVSYMINKARVAGVLPVKPK